MAKPSTTHVIEIEAGIGEPAFVPLTIGQELQPISVGKKGMWRIESARVLDVHAFVYFDGTSLFIQSTDDSAAVSVDGYRVGKAWTELHAPCAIEIGAATLRYRSLLDDGEHPQERRPPAPAPVPPLGALPGESSPVLPPGERPFAPGAFAAETSNDESTRVAPLETTNNRPGPLGAGPPRPVMGRLSDDDSLLLGGGFPRRSTPPPSPSFEPPVNMPPPMMAAMHPGVAMPPGVPHHSFSAPPGVPHHSFSAPPGVPHHSFSAPGVPHHSFSAPPGVPHHSFSAPPGVPMQPGMSIPPGAPFPPYGAVGPGTMQSGGFGSMTGGQPPAPPPEGSLARYVAKYKELSPPRRILVFLAPLCLVSSAYLLFFDDPLPPRTPTTAADAGADRPVEAKTGPVPIASQEAGAPVPAPVATCPPGFVPYSMPVAPGGPIPCVPVGTPIPGAGASKPVHSTTPSRSAGTDAGAASRKTLERQAVDAVAVNEYARAAAIYEQLERENQQNPTTARVYAEAARILRSKLDAGAP